MIVAIDNGNPTRLDSFRAKDYRAFNSLCLVAVRTLAGHAGSIVLSAEADGLRLAQTTLRTLKARGVSERAGAEISPGGLTDRHALR
jgi:beta-galactosidase